MKTIKNIFLVFLGCIIIPFVMIFLMIPGFLALFILWMLSGQSPDNIYGIIVAFIVLYLFYFKTKLGKKYFNFVQSQSDKFNSYFENDSTDWNKDNYL